MILRSSYQRRRANWISACRHASTSLANGVEERVSFDGTYHARQFGQTTTACGLPAHLWTNLYERPYRCSGEGSCPQCDDVVSRAAAEAGAERLGLQASTCCQSLAGSSRLQPCCGSGSTGDAGRQVSANV